MALINYQKVQEKITTIVKENKYVYSCLIVKQKKTNVYKLSTK